MQSPSKVFTILLLEIASLISISSSQFFLYFVPNDLIIIIIVIKIAERVISMLDMLGSISSAFVLTSNYAEVNFVLYPFRVPKLSTSWVRGRGRCNQLPFLSQGYKITLLLLIFTPDVPNFTNRSQGTASWSFYYECYL